MAEMSAKEAAKVLEGTDFVEERAQEAIDYAASLCRKLAAGELREVRHAEWIKGYVCNNCFHHNAEGMTPQCPYCGAYMRNGKDGGDGQAD